METAAALIASIVLAALVVFQLALAAGAPWGELAWGGQHRVLPTRLRVGSVISAGVYLGLGWVALSAAGLTTWDPPSVLVWVVFGLLALGIVMNAASRSRRERLVMTPVVVVLAGCFLVLALA